MLLVEMSILGWCCRCQAHATADALRKADERFHEHSEPR